jgi:hypothetical protein
MTTPGDKGGSRNRNTKKQNDYTPGKMTTLHDKVDSMGIGE